MDTLYIIQWTDEQGSEHDAFFDEYGDAIEYKTYLEGQPHIVQVELHEQGDEDEEETEITLED